MRGVLASAKAAIFAAFFFASGAICYLLLLLYAFVAYVLVLLATGIFMALILAVIPITPPREGYAFDIYLLILLPINFFMLGAFTIGTLLTFIFSPSRISQAISASSPIPGAKLQAVMMRASDVLRLPPFTRVIPCADFYVGVLKVGHRSVLCIDPDLIDVVGENRVASILAHEYGHLQPGRSISYGFIRRAMISVNFLRAELLTEDETTIFRRTVRIVTAIFPPVLKEGSRGVSHHLGRLFYRFYAVWIKLLTSAYRDEFHDAEFSADAFAYSAFGQEFPTALMEVAILQYVNKSRQLELNDEKILENWPIAYRSVSASHPSLEERIQRLGAEELANAGRQRELTLKYLRLGGATPPIVQASIPLLQSLCFDEFPNPEKIKTPCSYPD